MRLFEGTVKLPLCHMCGEHGIHGNSDQCLTKLHSVLDMLKQQQKSPPTLVIVKPAA